MIIKVKSFQALRFLMITSVFLAHISFIMTNERAEKFFYRHLNNGIFGVCFFFILSGFCIYLGYYEKFNTITAKSYFKFIQKRMVKIYPLYILMQTLWMIMELMKHPSSDAIRDLLLKYVISLPFLQMLLPSRELQISLNAVSWFCACLFWVYLVAPLIIMTVSYLCTSVKKLFLVIIGLILLYFGISSYSLIYLETGTYFINRSLIMGILMFTFGVCLSKLRLICNKEVKRDVGLFSLLELVVVIAAFWFCSSPALISVMRGYYVSRLLVIGCLIFVFSYDGGWISKIFSAKLFQVLGDASFEFY